MGKTYSFKDLSGAFAHPLAGAYTFAGQIGLGQITFTMATERTTHDVSADGSVMVSYIAGDNGSISIECQQTSDLHNFLLNWYNLCKTNADLGDVSEWASAALTVRSLVGATTHVCRGISPAKNPDKAYAAQGGKVTWNLMAADIQALTS